MRYQRKPGVSETAVDDGLFLVEPESQEIFYLEALSLGLWREMGEPRSLDELRLIVSEAFPEIEAGQIAGDIAALVADLVDKRLLLSVP